jgi:predicted permease
MTARELWHRVVSLWQRDRLASELADELEAHVELLARDLEREGMSPRDALFAARRKVGNLGQLRENSQAWWGFPAMERMLQDLRYAARGLRRAPGFAITVIMSFALGIGANAAMFGVVDRLMFRPLPYLREPSRVNRVYLQSIGRGRLLTYTTMPYTRYRDLARASTSTETVAGVSEWRVAVGRGDASRVRKIAGVSASLFDVFDAPPVLGRYFVPAEDSTPVGALVAVISHSFWSSEFGARNVTGQELQVGTLTYTIIGVSPPGFVGAVQGSPPDVFVPITTIPANINYLEPATYFTDYRWDWTEVLLKRKPGVTAEAASLDLTNAWVRSRVAQRAINPVLSADSIARPRAIAGPVRSAAGPDAGLEARTLLWVTGVAVIVLLIACANVANLMLARLLRRRREIAVRLALGVSRRRLMAQFLTESALLAGAGAVVGLVVAQWGGAAIRRLLLPEGSPFDLFADTRTLSVTAACAAAAVLLTTVGPALIATRADLAADLKTGAREGTYGRSRGRSALLVMQGALSVALLVGAGLFVRSLDKVSSIRLGYDARPVLEVIIDLRGHVLDSSASVAFKRRLLAHAQALPGVEAAARVNSRLFATNTATLTVPGIDSLSRLGRFNFQMSTSDYFKVMRTAILRGRPLTDQDAEGTPPVAVVSDAMARALWPGRDAIGQCLHVSFGPAREEVKPACTTVVGIAEDAAHQTISDEQRFMYYLSLDQHAPAWVNTMLLRMSSPDAAGQLERVRRELNKAMPGEGFVVMRPLQEIVDNQQRSWRLGATMFLAFGVLALAVAAVGLYGVISYNVTQRMHELGVRIALGAQTGDVLRLIVGQGLAFGAAGIAIGLTLALTAAPWMQPLLYKMSAKDPVTYGSVGLLMMLVSLAASAVPALRATRADPNAGLRSD